MRLPKPQAFRIWLRVILDPIQAQKKLIRVCVKLLRNELPDIGKIHSAWLGKVIKGMPLRIFQVQVWIGESVR